MKRKFQVSSFKFQGGRTIKFILFLLAAGCLPLAASVSADEVFSRAAVVMEASTGRILFAKNPNLKLLPASTTKLVTAMVVLDNAQMDDVLTISKKASKVPSVRKTRFKAGETVTVGMLLYAALLKSTNDAAYALAENIAGSEKKFVELMNDKMMAIGAFDTRFINTTGLPGPGQYTTAYDLAKIMRHALEYPLLREIIGTKEAEISTEAGRTIPIENTNRLLWSDEGAVGGKTGYTRAAKHCFTYAREKDGETIIVALLGAPSRTVLWNETEKLVEKGFDVMSSDGQPTIYFTKVDYRTSLKKSSRGKNYSKNNKAKLTDVSAKKKAKAAQEKNKDSRSSEKDTGKIKNTTLAKNRKDGTKG